MSACQGKGKTGLSDRFVISEPWVLHIWKKSLKHSDAFTETALKAAERLKLINSYTLKKTQNLPDIAQIFHLTVYFSISLQRTKTISLQKAHYLSSTYYLVFAPEEESLTKGQNKCSKILAMEFREFYIK